MKKTIFLYIESVSCLMLRAMETKDTNVDGWALDEITLTHSPASYSALRVMLFQIRYSAFVLIKGDLADGLIFSNLQTKSIMKTCTFVTGNRNKVIEVNAILGDSIPIRALALDIPEIQGSLEDIARDKCRRAAKIVTSLLLDRNSSSLTNIYVTCVRLMGR